MDAPTHTPAQVFDHNLQQMKIHHQHENRLSSENVKSVSSNLNSSDNKLGKSEISDPTSGQKRKHARKSSANMRPLYTG